MELIDIHCHLDFADFDRDREEVIKSALDDGVGMITIGATMEGSKKAVEIASQHEGVWACVGVHPEDVDKEIDFEELKELAKHEKVVAVGECGLDYFHNNKNKEAQKELFKKQIELALELDKPLMIHVREAAPATPEACDGRRAHDDVLEILKEYKNTDVGLRGNLHFYTGNWEETEKYLELGFSFSYTGVITFADQYNEVIKKLPLEKIMIETDAPFVAPVPHRGKRCEPIYVKEVAKRIAEIKNISYEEVAEQTTKNAIKLFNLK